MDDDRYSWKDRQRSMSTLLRRRDRKGGIFQMGCFTLILAAMSVFALWCIIVYLIQQS